MSNDGLQSEQLRKALSWANAGWPVFPFDPESKKPVAEWQKLATTDCTVLTTHWGHYPEDTPAIVPGLVGCLVVDVDVKNGKDGEKSLAALEIEHGFESWEVPQQHTPRGGRHLFFRGVGETSAGKLGEGIDTRGGTASGGLGFVHCYGDPPLVSDVPPAPASLVARIAYRDLAKSDETQKPRVEPDQPANVAKALAYVRSLDTPAEGERNDKVFRIAATLKDLGLSMAKAFELLEDHPSVTGDPPLCEDNPEEFNTTVRSAWRNGQLQPGIHGIDEQTRNEAAKGFDVGENQPKIIKKPRRFTLWPERANRPPPNWLIEDLLAERSLAGLYGLGGSYKSFLALDIALAVATGSEFLGRKLPPAPVVYVTGEGSPDARVLAALTKYPNPGNMLAFQEGLDLDNEEDCEELRQSINKAVEKHWHRPPALAVVDTLARATPGMEENSARDMGRAVQTCDSLKEAYQCCVLLLHHTPKGGQGWRGSSAVWNALDTAIEIRKGKGNRAYIEVTRQKDAETGAIFEMALESRKTGRERQGKPETSLAVVNLAPIEKNRERSKVAQTKAVEDLRADACRKILRNTAPGIEVSPGQLAGQVQKLLGDNTSRGATLAYIKSVVKKGVLQEDHALAEFVFDINYLLFQRKG